MVFKMSMIGLTWSIGSLVLWFRSHVLSLLISLEATMLFLLMYTYGWLSSTSSNSSLFLFLVLLTFAACEAALGLSLLVSMLRLRGNDLTKTTLSNLFFALASFKLSSLGI